MAYIEPIQSWHDPYLEKIVHQVLGEFGAFGPGFACADPQLVALSEYYGQTEKAAYFVALDDQRQVLGGAGIGPLPGQTHLCELQKMYLLPEGRSKGLGQQLMTHCLTFARSYYQGCYLETLAKMDSAQNLYRRNGFTPLEHPLGETGHTRCDTWYYQDL